MEKIEVVGASVDFFKKELDGVVVYEFDTSKCGPPEPMVNAMAGLQLLDESAKLIMINHKSPMGLFPKIEQEFNYEVTHLENGKVKVEFTRKQNATNSTDFSQKSCGG